MNAHGRAQRKRVLALCHAEITESTKSPPSARGTRRKRVRTMSIYPVTPAPAALTTLQRGPSSARAEATW